MQNSRRRKEMIVLMVLAALGGDARKKKGYEILNVAGPFTAMGALTAKVEAVHKTKEDAEREQWSVKMFVNSFLPAGFPMLRPELKLWVACQVVKRLIGTGWMAPKDPDAIEFVQKMYDLADNFTMSEPPGPVLTDFVVHSADRLRAKGLFV